MKSLLVALIAILSFSFLHAQNLNIGYQQLIGGNAADDGSAICIASDGDIVLAGKTQSTTNGFNATGVDVLVARYDGSGNLKWKKNIVGPYTELISGIEATEDNGCILAGYVEYPYDAFGSNRFRDLLVIRLDKDGNILWKKEYGSNGQEEGTCIKRSLDNGFFIGGEAYANGSHGGWDAWITKIDNNGNLKWHKFVGGSKDDYVRSLVTTPGNGVAFCGNTGSGDGDFPGGAQNKDAYIAELDSNGSVRWTKKYGGFDDDFFECIMLNADGTYSLAGESFSFELFGRSYPSVYGTSLSWFYQVNSTGNVIRWKGYTESPSSGINSILFYQGNYILLGSGLGLRGGFDVIMRQCDGEGNLLSSQVWGGSCSDGVRDAKITASGNLVAAGYTCSSNGDVGKNNGDYDALLLRIDRENKISGSVFIDNNKNSLRDADEQLLNYGNVQFLGQNGVIRSQLNKGAYSFLPGGTGNFTASIVPGAPAYAILSSYASLSLPSFYTNMTFDFPMVGDPLVTPSGANPVSENIKSKLRIDSVPTTYKGSTYVQRHYDIEPLDNPNEATATVTLYFSQEDFNRFNEAANHGADLPTAPNDLAGIANLRIHQYHQFSATGFPADYSGTMTVINPDDDKIVWDAPAEWWKVTFDVSGFSGFFITSVLNSALPAKLISFAGKNADNKNSLTWITAEEHEMKYFEVERSSAGSGYMAVGRIKAKGQNTGKNNYDFNDPLIATSVEYFYRLKIVDIDGRYEYSPTVNIRAPQGAIQITVSPNPASGLIVINYPISSKNSVIQLFDMSGRLVRMINNERNTTQVRLTVSTLTPGLYILVWSDGTQTLQKSVQVK